MAATTRTAAARNSRTHEPVSALQRRTGEPAVATDPQFDRDIREIERLAWLLDEAIRLPGGYRIGVDGLLGLIPGVGDALGMGASAYIILVARRRGLPRRTLARMTWNVLLEGIVGTVPLVGDLFDFAWKANTRNLDLLRRHHYAAREQAAASRPVV